MRLKRNKLRDAIALSLAVTAVTLAGSGAALAQETEESQTPTSLDAITVTGTRIQSQTFTASSPITEISSEEFTQFGATTVEDLVNQYPQVDLSFDNFENNGSYGHATVSMRGLGRELRAGVELEDGPVAVDDFALLELHEGQSLLRLTLHEGRKHVVRRLLDAVGHPVVRLVRTDIGAVSLGNQRPGSLRVLDKKEIGALYKAVGL